MEIISRGGEGTMREQWHLPKLDRGRVLVGHRQYIRPPCPRSCRRRAMLWVSHVVWLGEHAKALISQFLRSIHTIVLRPCTL